MASYIEATDYLDGFAIAPATLDGLAWARLIGGLGEFAGDEQYLAHFLHTDAEEVGDFFTNLVANNRALLEDDELALLLPDDSAEMSERLKALGQWCESFVSSLGASDRLQDANLAGRVNNHLHDLVEISKLDNSYEDDYDSPEAAELDFMELYEFLRVTLLALDLEFKSFDIDSGDHDGTHPGINGDGEDETNSVPRAEPDDY